MPAVVRSLGLLAFWVLLLFLGCAAQPPLERLKAQLASAPEYSIVLEDMKEEGVFFPTYYHKYRVVQGDQTWTTDWLEVSESVYRNHENFLGMTLASKGPDGETTTPHPPGYDYVGNPKYGQWRTDSSGRSFWEFYGQYALLRDLLGLGGRVIYRNDYDLYQTYRNQNRPYYGPNREYGTRGTLTRQTKPSFFERRRAREMIRRERFLQKFRRRVGRSRSPFRARGFGFGK